MKLHAYPRSGVTASGLLIVFVWAAGASPAGAARWTPIGPPDGATVLSLAYDPARPSTVYAGTAGGGVNKSFDGGRTWAPSSEGLFDSEIRALAVDAQDPRHVYAGTRAGLFRSRDRGRTWLPSTMKLPVEAIAVDPLSSGSLYVGTRHGMYRSTDGGVRWTRMGSDLVPYERRFWVPALVVAPSEPRVLYAAYVGVRSGIFRSHDGGKSWRRVLRTWQGLAVDPRHGTWDVLAVDPRDSDVLYVTGRGASGLLKTTDGGRTWHGLAAPQWMQRLIVDASGTVCALTESGAFMSDDGGVHWQEVGGLEGIWVRDLLFLEGTDTVLAGTTGVGVYRSDDGGLTWQSSSAGLVNFGARAVAFLPETSTILALGWNGLYWTSDGGATWGRSFVAAGSLRCLAVDPSTPDTIYVGGSTGLYDGDGVLFKSTDGGATWQSIAAGITPGPVVTLAVDPSDPQTVYAGTWDYWSGGLFRSRDGGATWARVPGIGAVQALAFDPSDPRVIYATQGRGLVHSRDGGRTWKRRMTGAVPPLAARDTQGVAVAPSDSDHLAVIDRRALFLSGDAGKTWVRSRECASSCSGVEFDPRDAQTIYLAHGDGVLRTTDGGATWTRYSRGLPGVAVYDFAFDAAAEPAKLYAATGSAGVFVIDLEP